MFNLNEKVRINIRHVWNRPDLPIPKNKREGTIIGLPDANDRYLVLLDVSFPREEGHLDWYFPEDTLVPLNGHRRMPAPDVELEEILMAQEIMEGLK